MNWYKYSQQSNITIDDIIWAIDDILLKTHDYTVEDLLVAEQRLGYSQDIAKAAQVKTRGPRAVKNKSNTKSLSSLILDLSRNAYTNREISNKLNIPIEQVTDVVKSEFPKLKDKQQYLGEEHDQNILGITDELHTNMMEDLSSDRITVDRISEALGGVSIRYIHKVLKDNNISLAELVAERVSKTEEMVVSVVQAMGEEPYSKRDVQTEFKRTYNHTLSIAAVNRALMYKNLSTYRMQTKEAQIFTAFKSFLGNSGISVSGANQAPVERIVKIIDNFIMRVGPEYGFVRPMSQMKIKEEFMTKLQLRERLEEQNRLQQSQQNIQDVQRRPIITDETHPSYFLGNENQPQMAGNKMNWYKKAIKERIPGGKAKGLPPEDFDKKQMEIGEEIEMEHTPDPAVAREIARDHLEEFPRDYYTGLTDMEEKLEKKKPARRGRYRGQLQGDENRPGGDVMTDIINDNEIVEGPHVKILHRMAVGKDWDGFNTYIQKLKNEGHNQTRIDSMMTRSMYGVKL